MHSREPHPPPGIAQSSCRDLGEMRNTLQLLRFFRLAAAAHTLAHAHFGARSQPWKMCTRKAERVRVQEATAQRYAGLVQSPTNPEPNVHKELKKFVVTFVCLKIVIVRGN